ncbi:MAG: hypothetical protein ACJAYP_001266 [Flavobacterium sp.]|jgi:hypothetical protein
MLVKLVGWFKSPVELYSEAGFFMNQSLTNELNLQ